MLIVYISSDHLLCLTDLNLGGNIYNTHNRVNMLTLFIFALTIYGVLCLVFALLNFLMYSGVFVVIFSRNFSLK